MTTLTVPKATSTAPARRRGLGLVVGILVLTLVIAASLAFGARAVSLSEIVDGLTTASPTDIGAIAVRERIPRTVLGLLAGAALALSGALMQAVTRNPLADPGILGVNTGASLAVVMGITFFGITSPSGYVWFALLGSAASAIAVYAIGSMGRGGATPIKLALAGAAMTAALSSLVTAILLPRADVMATFRHWQVGGVGGATWNDITTITPFLLLGVVIAALSAGRLDAMALGDDVAVGLGVPVAHTRAYAALGGVLLCGATTAVAGPIAFVGLMIPHAVRGLTGPNQRWMLALSALYGPSLLIASDTIGRVLGRPGEIEAGIITAFLGAPTLVWIARKARMSSL